MRFKYAKQAAKLNLTSMLHSAMWHKWLLAISLRHMPPALAIGSALEDPITTPGPGFSAICYASRSTFQRTMMEWSTPLPLTHRPGSGPWNST